MKQAVQHVHNSGYYCLYAVCFVKACRVPPVLDTVYCIVCLIVYTNVGRFKKQTNVHKISNYIFITS